MKTRKDYYTVAEAAEVLGKSVPTIYRWIQEESLTPLKNPVTQRLMLSKSQITERMEALKEWG